MPFLFVMRRRSIHTDFLSHPLFTTQVFTKTFKKRKIKWFTLALGYYGCGHCQVCRISAFGDKFKIQHSNNWYKIKGWILLNSYIHLLNRLICLDCIDCESENVLYIATCLLCDKKVQYGGYAFNIKTRLGQHKVLSSF